jgi:ABC-type spermidine/putrescine transport system permease subunit II
VVAVLVVAPFAILALAAVAGSWTGALPSGLTGAHLAEALDADGLASLLVSVQTALLAGAVSVLVGTWAALAAGLDRLDPAYELAARSLGAGPARVLSRVRLPLLLPSLAAAAGLAVALSMGELGATIMIYPPSWRTLPVTIFTASDRGDSFLASASTVVLLAVTGLMLFALSRVRSRAAVG